MYVLMYLWYMYNNKNKFLETPVKFLLNNGKSLKTLK